MPAGRIHNQATLWIAPVAAISAAVALEDLRVGAAVGVGVLAGLFFSPDLDVDGATMSDWIMQVWFGKLPRFIWRALWFPYAKLLPHRSFLSHGPVISTLLRMAYFYVIVHIASIGKISLPAPSYWTLWGLVGLVISDCLHWAMDNWRPPWR